MWSVCYVIRVMWYNNIKYNEICFGIQFDNKNTVDHIVPLISKLLPVFISSSSCKYNISWMVESQDLYLHLSLRHPYLSIMLAKIYFKKFVFDIYVTILHASWIGFFYSYFYVALAHFSRLHWYDVSIKLNVILQVEILTTFI